MKLAILIIGTQNSGKTSTIKYLINTHSTKKLSVMRAGWNSIFFNSSFMPLRLNFFCVPASPTETNKKLSIRFLTTFPTVLIVAEQLGGKNYHDTITFLSTNGYHVLTYNILNTNGSGDWERYNSSNETIKLNNRISEIIIDIKNYIKTSGII